MAVGAAPSAAEELRPLGGIAAYLISQRAISSAVGAAIGREFHLEVDILRNVVEVIRGEARKARHAALRTPVLDHRPDLFAFFIVQHQHGADQVRTLRAACGVAVAGGAILFVYRLAFPGGGFVGSRSQAEEF